MTKSEQFARLNNLCISDDLEPYREPNFDAKSILEVMRRRVDFRSFFRTVGTIMEDEFENEWEFEICLHYILNPDELLDVAIEWCISHK